MKNNQLTAMFVGLLLLSTLLSIGLLYKYNSSVHTAERLAPRIQQINILQALLNDTVRYNETAKNPDMQRILQAVNTPRPAAKPATK